MIYFVRLLDHDKSFVKVGFVKNFRRLPKRLSELQCGNPYQLEIVAVINGSKIDEQNLHKKLALYRCFGGGREWYEIDVKKKDSFKAVLFQILEVAGINCVQAI